MLMQYISIKIRISSLKQDRFFSYAGAASNQSQNKPTKENTQSQTKAQKQPNYLQDFKEILQSVMNQMIAITNLMADLMIKIEQHSIS